MERQPRRKFSAAFKAKVVIEALKERSTIEELARRHELHPNQITMWKKEFLDKAPLVFEDKQERETEQEREEVMGKLYAQIGQQKVEIDWLKKKLE